MSDMRCLFKPRTVVNSKERRGYVGDQSSGTGKRVRVLFVPTTAPSGLVLHFPAEEKLFDFVLVDSSQSGHEEPSIPPRSSRHIKPCTLTIA